MTTMPDFSFKHSDQVDEPSFSASDLKMYLDIQAKEIRDWLNGTFLPAYDAHLTETVSYFTSATRDLSIEGSQIISGFPFIPKCLLIEVVAVARVSFGRVVQNGQHAVFYRPYNSSYNFSSVQAIAIYESSGNATRAGVVINGNNTITLNWFKEGTGAVGTADVRITALGHGG